jgi:hypothetical protein
MTDFSEWRTFDYQNAMVQLWVFKNSSTLARFRAWHVRTDEEIENMFRGILESEVTRITESLPYTILSQNNDNSCLLHSLNESEGLASLLVAVNAPETENTIAQLKQLQGASGYLVKFQDGGRTESFPQFPANRLLSRPISISIALIVPFLLHLDEPTRVRFLTRRYIGEALRI